MMKNSFFARLAQAGLALTAALIIGACPISCNKEKNKAGSRDGLITMTANRADKKDITLWFGSQDKPVAEGLQETSSSPGAEGWVIKKYRIINRSFSIKGKVTKLNCSGGELSSLEARNNKLEVIYCQNNLLESLDASGCAQLKELYCHHNLLVYERMSLPSVNGGKLYFKDMVEDDMQQLTPDEVKEINKKGWSVFQQGAGGWESYPGKDQIIKMTTEKSQGDQIILGFDDEDEPKVTGASLKSSEKKDGWLANTYEVSSQDINITGKVTKLDCSANLTYLDVSGNSNLEKLVCVSNNLNSLDVSKNIKLSSLYCYNSGLLSLNFGKNMQLVELECYNNRLSSLDLSGCLNLEEVKCSNNNLTYDNLKLPSLEKEGILYFRDEGAGDSQKLMFFEVEAMKELGWRVKKKSNSAWVDYTGDFYSIIMKTDKKNGEVIDLWFGKDDKFQVEGADFQESSEESGWIKTKYIVRNQQIKVEGKITKFNSYYNALFYLEAIDNKMLTVLGCSGNNLSSLYLSGCSKLTLINCSANKITSYSNLYLPKVDKGELRFKYGYLDSNKLSTEEVNNLRKKGWAVKHWDSGEWKEYQGFY